MKKTTKKSLIVSSLAVAVQGLLFASLATTAQANTTTPVKKPIGDLEIYQAAQGGSKVVAMMLDISGSMQASDTPGCVTEASPGQRVNAVGGFMVYHLKDKDDKVVNEITRADGTKVDTSKGVTLPFVGCNNTPARRIDLLKKAMMDLVQKEDTLPNVKLGVGTFPTPMSVMTGRMAIPAKELTPEHRWDILNFIATTNTVGATPSAVAYVEAGAYMLGTKTANLGTPKKLIYTVGRSTILTNQNMQLLYCGSAALERWVIRNNVIVRDDLKPVMMTIGGEQIPWYTCNDGSNANFPPINHDQRLQAGEAQAAFGYWDKLNFGLFPKFEYLAKDLSGLRPAVKAASNTDKSDGSGNYFRMGNGQLAQSGVGGYDFGHLITYRESNVANAGFPYSEPSTKKADGNSYQSPIGTTASKCDGYGIYFLTDGEPNMAYDSVLTSANMSLNETGEYKPHVSKSEFPDGVGNSIAGRASGYWNFIASYSKDLRTGNNPLKAEIKTATVGFGGVFSGASDNKVTKLVDGEEQLVTDCDKISKQDAKNLCKWGEKGWGYGEGGFLATSEAAAVTESVIEFAKKLKQIIPTAPSGTISIPDDPYSVGGQQAVAYMPMIEPKVAAQDMIWPGNMKKYHLANGTVWGKNAKRLYTNVKGDLNPEAQDGWSESAVDNNKVTVGGFYAHLKNPKDNRANIRQVYIEDFTGTGTTAEAKKPKLRKLGVNAQGKITLDGQVLSTTHTFHDTQTYTLANVAYLLHFLGFEQATAGTNTVVTLDKIPAGTQLTAITLQVPTNEIRVLGASPHSTPTTVSYGAALDANTGNVSLSAKDRDDYVLFGSMDGALHLVDARDRSQDAKSTTGLATGGEEVFAFIPKVMIQKQARALQFKSTHAAGDKIPDGQPVFGVDAPWAVMADYDFDNDDNPTKMVVNTKKATKSTERDGKGIYAYGGFRLGGEGLYGLNLSTKGSPTLAFALTPQQTGFERLGQIWAKPVSARIKKDGVSKDVIIFGGGYDLCYENEDFQVGITNDKFAVKNDQRGAACSGKTEAIGNAVYMVDAQTGARLWTATHGQMKHSVVGGVTPLDRDNDGNIDAIYFADLGGQVFRADFDNSGNSFAEKRVTRLLKPAGAGKMVRRFYEKPVVSIYRADQTFKEADAHKINHDLFALVNVVSGDRSNPTSKMRTDLADADRLYGIFDTDIGGTDFYTKTTLSASEIEDSQLENLSNVSVTADVAGVETKRTKINTVKTKKGWYQPIVDFDGYTNVRYGKGIGKSEVIGSLLFSSVYNPDKVYAAAQECTASIKGGTERQMYCLPYGVCLDARSTNGKGGFSPAGQGISELTLGPLDGSSAGSRKRVVISNVGLNPDSSVAGTGRVNYGEGVADSSIKDNQSTATTTGGSGSDPTIIFDHRFTLQPLRWYDNSVKN